MTIRPYFVEVLGTPEAGKTTAIKGVISSLSGKGYTVQYIREAAEIVPEQLKKGSGEAHIWMSFNVAQNIMTAKFSNADIVLIDRGIQDIIFWNDFHYKIGNLTQEQFNASNAFFKSFDLMPQLTIALTTEVEEAIHRRGGEGRIVTKAFLKQYNQAFCEFCNEVIPDTIMLDTTNMTPSEVVEFMESTIKRYFHC